MFVARSSGNDSTVTAFAAPTDLLSRLRRRLRHERISRDFARYRPTRPVGYELFSDDRTQHGSAPLSQLPACDVIDLHWIAGFIDFQSFFAQVSKSTPIVWTLHDMNPFTGGCHYDDGCGRFADHCGACPQLGSNDLEDLSRRIWERKRRFLDQIEPGQLHIATPSRWLAGEAQRSSLFRHLPIYVIPNSLDTDVFLPRDRYVARAALEVPQDAGVAVFVASSVVNRRKGFALLARALTDLGDFPNLFLLSVGSGRPAIDASIPHLHLQNVGDDRLLSLVYSAADLLVIPSIQDNLPNAVLECLACGTPAIGFAVGGIPDVVRPGITGLLAPSQDTGALRAAMVQLLRSPTERARMSDNCRRVAVEEYALDVQARRYVDLYELILASNQIQSHRSSLAVQPSGKSVQRVEKDSTPLCIREGTSGSRNTNDRD
jgi:glycosyltransferase involved in cell wall biosynthesis